MKNIAKCFIRSVVALAPLAASAFTNITEAVFEAQPGEDWQMDWTWHELDVPQTAFIKPHVTAWDAAGRQVFSRDVGRTQQRVFGPEDFAVQKWRIYAHIAAGTNAAKPSFFTALASVTLPAATHRVRMTLSQYGDPAKFDRVTMGVTKLSAPPPPTPYGMSRGFPEMSEDGLKVLTDEELDAVLAKRVKCTPRLVSHGDCTEMLIDGRPVVPRIYKGPTRACRNRLPAVSVYGRRDFDIFTVGIGFRPSPRPGSEAFSGIWREDGTCDSGKVRRLLREYLRRFPDGHFMLCFGVAPPVGWGEAHPSEIYRTDSGKYGIFTGSRITALRDKVECDLGKGEYPAVSYTSEAFGDMAEKFMERLFADLEDTPEGKALVGVYACGGTDGQWLDLFDNHVPERQAADYSDVARRRFAEFRRAKYGRQDVDVRIPTAAEFWNRERCHYAEHASTPMSDYCEFSARAATELRLRVARGIKRGSRGRLLVGSYSPNGGMAGYPLISVTYAKGLLESPDYDFFAVVPSYEREHVDPVVAAAFDGSMVRRGKLYISELDLRSGDVGNWGFWGSEFWRSTHNAATFRRKALYFAANALTHGAGYHAYDMDGGWYATAEAQDTWQAVNRMAAHARPMPFAPERIAIVGGERYWDFQSFGRSRVVSYLLREQPREALARTGVQWNQHLVDELLESQEADLPKVVVFNDLTCITHAQYAELRRRYAKDGRVIVWCYRPGLFAADGARIEEELGLRNAPKALRRLGFADGSCTDPLMAGVKGTLMPSYPYYGFEFPDVICAPDPAAGWKALAPFKGTDIPALAVRRHADFTEVYTSMPGGITSRLCRNLVRAAGLKPLVNDDDISGYGSGIFYILAQTTGVKRFRLPDGVAPDKVLAGPDFRRDGERYAVRLNRADIFILSVRQ